MIDDNIPDEMSIEYTSDNYVNDYTLLKNEDGNQINSFLGFILNDDKKIVKGYACGIMNNNPFCLENDINKYEEMKEMLNEIYNKKDCVEYEYDFHCYGNVNADIDKFGNIYVEDKNYYCSINNGSMNCVPR